MEIVFKNLKASPCDILSKNVQIELSRNVFPLVFSSHVPWKMTPNSSMGVSRVSTYHPDYHRVLWVGSEARWEVPSEHDHLHSLLDPSCQSWPGFLENIQQSELVRSSSYDWIHIKCSIRNPTQMNLKLYSQSIHQNQ